MELKQGTQLEYKIEHIKVDMSLVKALFHDILKTQGSLPHNSTIVNVEYKGTYIDLTLLHRYI